MPSFPRTQPPRTKPSRPSAHATRPNIARRAALRALVAAALLPLAADRVRADVIPVRSAELRIDDGEVLLSAQFHIALTPALDEALHKGIPLYFTIEFELARPRWYWIDEKVTQWSITHRVSYSELTRQYRVSSGPLSQPFESLDDVLRFIGRVSSRPVARADQLTKAARHDAAIRIRLDVNQLPKPFQLSALTSHEWQLASEWHRWTLVP
jgi:hypothetical protein